MKRYLNWIIDSPVTIESDRTIRDVRSLMARHGVTGLGIAALFGRAGFAESLINERGLGAEARWLWWMLAVWMAEPLALASVMLRFGAMTPRKLDELAAGLRGVAGVTEVVVLPADAVAYLRVDPAVFDPASLSGLPVTVAT